MFFVDTIEVSGLGNRSCLAGGERTDVAVDPPRDVDQVIAAVAGRGVRISHVVETRVHNDYVTGGLELARITGAAYLVPGGARVSFARIPVQDGDRTEIDADAGPTLRAVATPGHTPHHTAYALEGDGPTMLGGALAGRVPEAVLTAAFALVAGGAALRMLRSRPAEEAAVAVRPGRAAAAGGRLGAVTGVLGVGGGFLAVPALVGGAGPADADRGGQQPAGYHRRLPGRAGDPRRYGRGAGPGGRRAVRRGCGPRGMGRQAAVREGVRAHASADLRAGAAGAAAVAAFMVIDAVL